jgi:hypothetical protein
MNLKKRKENFISLGEILEDVLDDKYDKTRDKKIPIATLNELEERIETTRHHNGWFTQESIAQSLQGIIYMLKRKSMDKWISMYPGLQKEVDDPKKVGIVMAGNLPLGGFHDFLAVLLSGNIAYCKLSSSDDRLLPIIIQILVDLDEEFADLIKVVSQLKGIDAVIATGSNNTSRYFEYYFGKYPHIIRKNRNAVAVLRGDESEEELNNLAKDVFSFFGLGCRNVSKVFLPEGMDLDKLIGAFFSHKDIINHNKYANNYDYNKTVMLLNQDDLIENGFLLLKESDELASPLATLYFEYYSDYDKLMRELDEKEDQIQCVVGREHVAFGKAQTPELWEYADGVDTMQFLISLNT